MTRCAKKRGRRTRTGAVVSTATLTPRGAVHVPSREFPPAAPADKEVPRRRPLPAIPDAAPNEPHRPKGE